jgi:catechol 2,3-dioxygenase-like lactoylglutathione lyase family enzyme
MEFSHLGLVVGNLEKSIIYYSEKLGIRIKYGDPKLLDPVALDIDSCLLILTPKLKAEGRPAGEFSFCFSFKDALELENKIKELRARGLNPAIGPYRNNLGQFVVRFAGSDNEVIEFYAPPESALDNAQKIPDLQT